MIDIGITKLAMIGVVALIVIGPEKLPRVARMVGTLLGKAQRYVADVKAEVNRSMELDELKKMKDSMESAAKDVQNTIHSNASDFEKAVNDTTNSITSDTATDSSSALDTAYNSPLQTPVPEYKRPTKNWRVKRSAVPQWYKARSGVRGRALSGAARVARFRPPVRSGSSA